jgi:hypothetical protein
MAMSRPLLATVELRRSLATVAQRYGVVDAPHGRVRDRIAPA